VTRGKKGKGSKRRRWYRMDLHLHTPASEDWRGPKVPYLEWLRTAEAKGLDIVAMTDHNTLAGYAAMQAEIEHLAWLEESGRITEEEKRQLDAYRSLLEKVLVLPGFEFTAALGFHILGIFSPETPVRDLQFLLLRLNVPPDKLDAGATAVGATTDVLTAYRVIREAGGLVIAAHANSAHGVMMRGLDIGGQTRIAYTQDPNLHALEVTDLGSRSRHSTARFFNGTKAEYPRRMHLIQGSDAHSLEADPRDKNRLGIGDRAVEIALEERSFAAIKAVFESTEFDRIRKPRARPTTQDPLAEARQAGEGERLAFHTSATRQGGHLHKVLCDVVSMANTRGGTIIVGASPKPSEPPGGVEHPKLTAKELEEEIKSRVVPNLPVTIHLQAVKRKHVLVVNVPEGSDKPYAVDGYHIYVRRGSETTRATRDDIVALVTGKAVQPAGQTRPPEAPPERPAQARPEPTTTRGRRRRGKRNNGGTDDQPGVAPPSNGVEIVGAEERQGKRLYIIRDLRNGTVVSDVSRQSARRLWEYAITQREEAQFDPDEVTWLGDLGIWRFERRAGKVRYNLVQRLPDGQVKVYYGVTEDGFTGQWADLLPIAREMAALLFDEMTSVPTA